MKNFKGTIIEESLEDTSVLKVVEILSTKVEKVTEKHKTPWISRWTLHIVEIPEDKAMDFAEKISHDLDGKHNWYVDFKNGTYHYIIFKNKVFYINRHNKKEYDEVTRYGISLGIPSYQLDFSPDVK